MFSGSYLPDDVTFLMKPVQLAPTEIREKERLIQSGERHYSEMISRESLPSPAYLRVFQEALKRETPRFAMDVMALAYELAAERRDEIVIASLARAGTPIGVLLVRALRHLLGRDAVHYSISIIRDRGIDENALRFMLNRHAAESIAFVDGWTGKGVIAAELRKSVRQFNEQEQVALDGGLWAVADLCGAAEHSATFDDYLIPSSVLGCTVSGLVSRSILNREVIGAEDFHGCLYYEQFAAHDWSRQFVDTVFHEMERVDDRTFRWEVSCQDARKARRLRSETFLGEMRRRFQVNNPNYIKPGLGEATRVLLRRVPHRLLVHDAASPAVAHLVLLAAEKKVPIEIDRTLPYAAAALIEELDG